MNYNLRPLHLTAIIVSFVLALTMVGCVSVGRKLDQAQVDQIRKGQTTRQDVLRLIGSPDQMTKDSDGNITFSYLYVRSSPKGETFIPVVGAFAGGANVQSQSVVVTFGSDDVVTKVVSSCGATESGLGAEAGSKANLKDVEKNKRPK